MLHLVSQLVGAPVAYLTHQVVNASNLELTSKLTWTWPKGRKPLDLEDDNYHIEAGHVCEGAPEFLQEVANSLSCLVLVVTIPILLGY